MTTLIDNQETRENLLRLGEKEGCQVTVETRENGIYMTLRKSRAAPAGVERQPVSTGTVLFIASELLGRGNSRAVGTLLMQSFLHTLSALRSRPGAVIFINYGVKLVTGDSPVLRELRLLENQGAEIIACGTCLSRLELSDRVAVGQVSNMYTIADTLMKAEKIISFQAVPAISGRARRYPPLLLAGKETVTLVPSAGVERTSSLPPTDSARSCMEIKPR